MAKREMLKSEIETMSERASLVIWESYGTEIMLAPGKGKESGVSLIITFPPLLLPNTIFSFSCSWPCVPFFSDDTGLQGVCAVLMMCYKTRPNRKDSAATEKKELCLGVERGRGVCVCLCVCAEKKRRILGSKREFRTKLFGVTAVRVPPIDSLSCRSDREGAEER